MGVYMSYPRVQEAAAGSQALAVQGLGTVTVEVEPHELASVTDDDAQRPDRRSEESRVELHADPFVRIPPFEWTPSLRVT